MSYLETAWKMQECCHQTCRCLIWLGAPLSAVLGAGLPSLHAARGSFSIFQSVFSSTEAGGFAQGSGPAGDVQNVS